MGGKHHRHTRALLYCQCFRRGKKVDKEGSTKEKGARTLVVPELRALRHSRLDKGGGSGGGGMLGPVASVGSLLGLPRVENCQDHGEGEAMGGDGAVPHPCPWCCLPKALSPYSPRPQRGKLGGKGGCRVEEKILKKSGRGEGSRVSSWPFTPPSSSLLSSRF